MGNWMALLAFIPTIVKLIQDITDAWKKKSTTTYAFKPDELHEKKIEALATYLACCEQLTASEEQK